MEECIFCKLDENKIANTIIEETENFYIKPSLGALVEGYILIISKKHINSMAELNESEKIEYLSIIEKYRNLFKKIYNRFPIIFEHGTNGLSETSASSIVHAHTHIVNHNYTNEKSVLESLNFRKINDIFHLERINKSYIFYINPIGIHYITYDFKPVSQIMRIIIAKDLNMEEKYNWKQYPFTKNIMNTIDKFIGNTKI